MTIDTAQAPPLWRRFALGSCIFLIVGANGFLQPFVPLYLTAIGLSKENLGTVLAVGTGASILIQPLLGKLSDRFDARRPIMVVAAIAAGFAYLAYRFSTGMLVLTFLTMVGANGYQYLNSVAGVLVGRMARASRGGGAAYVRYRVWGSIGYICIAIGAGQLIKHALGHGQTGATASREALDPVFLYGPIVFFVVAAISLFVPDARAAPRGEGSAASAAPAVGVANLHRFLPAFFLYQIALYGASAFLPLYMNRLGGSSTWVTVTFAAGAVSEAIVMTQVGKWTDRFGRRPAIAVAFLVMPMRLFLYTLATGPAGVLAVQLLHGFNFGIMGTVTIVFVNEHATDANRGALQARLAATIGLALAIGPLVCGYISQHLGLRPMFASMSALGAVAAIMFLTQVRESHPSPDLLHRRLRWLA